MILNKRLFAPDLILLTNIVFSFFPISFILGNFAINLNTILFCCLGIFHLKSKIIKIKFNFPIKVIFWLFILIFFSTALSFIESLYFNHYEKENLIKLLKSIVFFRYFLLLIIVCYLSELDILDFKYFFVSAAFASLFISIDVIIQYIFGYNIVGMKWNFDLHARHFTSFFGDELISGGFIQNFSFFSILFLTFILRDKKNINSLLIAIIICLLGVSIFLSGNRMSLILFLLGLFLIYFLNNRFKKIIPATLLTLFLIFTIAFFTIPRAKETTMSYYQEIKDIVNNINITFQKDDLSKKEDNKSNILQDDFDSFWVYQTESEGYIKLFYTSLDTWKKNKIFGNGMKSFRKDCIIIERHTENRLCSNHPHNYYLEILTETGLIGISFVILMGFLFLFFLLKNLKFLNGDKIENFIFLAVTISLILEVFPIKSSGSIFSTNNTTYIILLSSIFLSYKKIIENYNLKNNNL